MGSGERSNIVAKLSACIAKALSIHRPHLPIRTRGRRLEELPMFRFTIRDVLWFTVVVALG
jgi:hypothetical protein